MNAKRLDNGRLLVPLRAEGKKGLIGDGWVEIGPDHPDYKKWTKDIERSEQLESDYRTAILAQAAEIVADQTLDDKTKKRMLARLSNMIEDDLSEN